MAIGMLVINVIFTAANAVAGGLLAISALMTAFAVVGQVLLEVRHSRALRFEGAPGHAHSPARSGAAVVTD